MRWFSKRSCASRSARRLERRALVSIVGIALLGAVAGAGWTGDVYAGPGPVRGVAVVPLDDGFEAGTTFRGGFCDLCEDFFRPVESDAHTGRFAFFAPDSATAGSVSANGAPVVIPENASAAELTFWQRFEFEHNGSFNFDGGVLEILTDDDDDWVEVGSHITAGGYNGTIVERGGGNPLEGRAAWVGDSSGWQQVTVDLMAYRGHRVRFQPKMGTDLSNNSPVGGWWIDDFRVTYRAPLSACGREWTSLTSHPTGARGAFVAGIGANLYAFGGVLNGEASAAAWRYSTGNDRWDPIAALPEERLNARAVSDGRYIYILGGLDGLFGSPTSTLWRYDPVANSYVTLAPFATATADHAAVYLDGTIYKLGGQTDDDGHAFTKAVEAYSVANDSWSAVADLPEGLGDLAAAAIDGHLYTAGGHIYFFSRDDTYRYDVTGNTWDSAPIAELPATATSASGVFYNGTWIVFADDFPIGWDPRTNVWRSLDMAPRPLVSTALAVVGDAAYVLGTVFDGVALGDTELLQYAETNCACLGDCSGDGAVSISDLIKGVGIALRTQPLSGCTAFDGNSDGNVAINELVTAVGNALQGCGGG